MRIKMNSEDELEYDGHIYILAQGDMNGRMIGDLLLMKKIPTNPMPELQIGMQCAWSSLPYYGVITEILNNGTLRVCARLTNEIVTISEDRIIKLWDYNNPCIWERGK